MDFEHVLTALLNEFDHREIRYAVVGGFAMGALGAPRMTMDLDILVDRDDLQRLDQGMSGVGYLRLQEQADIERLLAAHQNHVDWARIQEYYELFEMGEEARRLKERFGHAEPGSQAGA